MLLKNVPSVILHVLVNVDLLGYLLTSIMMEKGNHWFEVGIDYENMQEKCTQLQNFWVIIIMIHEF
jgi:hypothetical protein